MGRRCALVVVLAAGCGGRSAHLGLDAARESATTDTLAEAAVLATPDAGSDAGSSDGSGQGVGDTGAAVLFCQRLIDALVDWEVACNPGFRAALDARYDRDFLCGRIASSVAAGRLVFDASQSNSCLEWLRAYPCGPNNPLNWKGGPCLDALAGQVQPDSACYAVMIRGPFGTLDEGRCIANVPCSRLDFGSVPDECGRGAHCDQFDACPGTCRRDVREGESCQIVLGVNPRPLCTPGTFCDDSGGQVCRRLGGQGAPCLGESCQDQLACDSTGPDGGVCQPRRADGACTDSSQCVGRCAFRATTGPGTCMPVATLGEPCVGVDVPDVCGSGMICDGHTCVALPGPGEVCRSTCVTGVCPLAFPGQTVLCSGTIPLGGACQPLFPDDCGPRGVCLAGPRGAACLETCHLR